MSDFVVLKTFQLAIEAEILCGRLESEGVRCFLEGNKSASVVGDFNRVNMSWSSPLGGTKVLVSENDLARAREFLREIEPNEDRPKTRRRANGAMRVFQFALVLSVATPFLLYLMTNFGWLAASGALVAVLAMVWIIGS